MGSGNVFVMFGSSCEGVDSNQCLPLQCKLCMNIKDIYFGKSDFFLDVHAKMVFVLTSTIQFNVLTQYVVFKGFFAYMWLEIWDTLHTPKARRLAYCGLHILA